MAARSLPEGYLTTKETLRWLNWRKFHEENLEHLTWELNQVKLAIQYSERMLNSPPKAYSFRWNTYQWDHDLDHEDRTVF